MPGFPLLELPLLAQKMVIKHFTTTEIINLSLCSAKAADSIHFARVKLDTLCFECPDENTYDMDIFLGVGEHAHKIQVRQGSAPENLEKPTKWFYSKTESLEWFLRSSSNSSVFVEKYKIYEACDVILEFCKYLFKWTAGVHILMSPQQFIMSWVVQKHAQSIKKLVCTASEVDNLFVTEEELIFIIGKTKGIIQLECQLDHGFFYTAAFEADTVSINCANWVHMDSILQSTSRVICIFGLPWFFSITANTLLKNWLTGEFMKNLVELHLGGWDRLIHADVLRKSMCSLLMTMSEGTHGGRVES